MNTVIMSQSEAQRIAQGFYDYSKANFKHFNKLGYFEVQVNNCFDKQTELSLSFGAGWCNTPWHDDLLSFFDSLVDRVQKKYPTITHKTLCGYSCRNSIAKVGGMISEQKLFNQMRYPEQY